MRAGRLAGIRRNLTERDIPPDRGSALDHQFSRAGPGYGMHEADLRAAPRLGSRTRHYHHDSSDEAANQDPAPSGHRERILKMTPESFVHAVQDLDPGTRALLDLSVHRGLDDAEIAELLGADPGYVSSSREAAIAQLASDLGMHGDPERVRDALTEMPGEAWRPRVDGEAVGQSDSEAANGAAPEHVAEPSEGPRSQRRLTLFVLLVVAAVAAAVIASGAATRSSPPRASPRRLRPRGSSPSRPHRPPSPEASPSSRSARRP